MRISGVIMVCLLYTSDAADDLLCVDLGGRRIIKKKKKQETSTYSSKQEYTGTYMTDAAVSI